MHPVWDYSNKLFHREWAGSQSGESEKERLTHGTHTDLKTSITQHSGIYLLVSMHKLVRKLCIGMSYVLHPPPHPFPAWLRPDVALSAHHHHIARQSFTFCMVLKLLFLSVAHIFRLSLPLQSPQQQERNGGRTQGKNTHLHTKES